MKRLLCAIAILSLCASCVSEVQAGAGVGVRRAGVRRNFRRNNFRGFRRQQPIIIEQPVIQQVESVVGYGGGLRLGDNCGCAAGGLMSYGAVGLGGCDAAVGFADTGCVGGLGYGGGAVLLNQGYGGFGGRRFFNRGGRRFGGFNRGLNRGGFSLGGALLGGFLGGY